MQANLPLSYATADLDNMPAEWRDDFEKEVAAGNFMLGKTSLYLSGPNAENASRHWIACLALAGFKCYRITPYEAIRRAEGKSVYADTDERQAALAEAECVLVDDFFNEDASGFTDEMNYVFGWFLRELHARGVTLIIASDKTDPGVGMYTDTIWAWVLNTFEVIKHETTGKPARKVLKKRQGAKDSIG